MKRRDFITLLGGAAAAWPLAARAQRPSLPVIGFLGAETPDNDVYAARLRAFRQGLGQTGYVEGRNVTIEYRWAEGRNDRLPALAADLVSRHVSVIVPYGGSPALLAAKEATATIPIVFAFGGDPVKRGIIPSLNRPGGNLTGITSLTDELGPKRLELLHEVAATARVFGFLVNPENQNAEIVSRDLEGAARALGLEVHVLHASNERELEPAFAALLRLQARGLVIGGDPLFNSRPEQLGPLAIRYAMPAIYQYRPFAAAGGLMSYGADETETGRQLGIYTGRVLKGEKPSDLPVQEATKVELIVNLKIARMLGISVPLELLARADEVIE
jgi:putative ABC transport system substrate-binding protein